MLKPFAAIAIVAVLFAGGAYALMCSVPRATNGAAAASLSTAAAEPASSIALVNHDAASGTCKSDCATTTPFREADLVAQPDVKTGQLTKCPVNGEVFRVDDKRPRYSLAGHDYVFCCDDCAKKFHADPAHYVSL
jgi:YHS domain-containing protein